MAQLGPSLTHVLLPNLRPYLFWSKRQGEALYLPFLLCAAIHTGRQLERGSASCRARFPHHRWPSSSSDEESLERRGGCRILCSNPLEGDGACYWSWGCCNGSTDWRCASGNGHAGKADGRRYATGKSCTPQRCASPAGSGDGCAGMPVKQSPGRGRRSALPAPGLTPTAWPTRCCHRHAVPLVSRQPALTVWRQRAPVLHGCCVLLALSERGHLKRTSRGATKPSSSRRAFTRSVSCWLSVSEMLALRSSLKTSGRTATSTPWCLASARYAAPANMASCTHTRQRCKQTAPLPPPLPQQPLCASHTHSVNADAARVCSSP